MHCKLPIIRLEMPHLNLEVHLVSTTVAHVLAQYSFWTLKKQIKGKCICIFKSSEGDLQWLIWLVENENSPISNIRLTSTSNGFQSFYTKSF